MKWRKYYCRNYCNSFRSVRHPGWIILINSFILGILAISLNWTRKSSVYSKKQNNKILSISGLPNSCSRASIQSNLQWWGWNYLKWLHGQYGDHDILNLPILWSHPQSTGLGNVDLVYCGILAVTACKT